MFRQHIRHPQRQKRTGSRTDPRNRQRKLSYAPHVRGRAKITEQIKRQKTNRSRQRQIAPDERISARQQSDSQRDGQQPANTQQFRHEHADDEQRQQKPIHIERPKQHILHPRLLFRAHEIPQIVPIVVDKPGLDVACGAIGIGEITSIPTAPAIADAYFRYDGERRTKLPLTNTPYERKGK